MRDWLRHNRTAALPAGHGAARGMHRRAAQPPAAVAGTDVGPAPTSATRRPRPDWRRHRRGRSAISPQAPFDEPRQALVPRRVDAVGVGTHRPRPRLAVVDARRRPAGVGPQRGHGTCGSRRSADGAPEESVLLDGLDQPHGLAFAGSTLYVAESDQVDAYDYADGAASRPTHGRGRACRTRAAPTCAAPTRTRSRAWPSAPTARCTSRSGPPATSPPTTAPPTRRAPRSCGYRPAAGRPNRSPPACATAPVSRSRPTARCGRRSTTATTSRSPTRARTTDGSIADYVNDHPPEQLARLTPGRELGWPYCNPDGGPADLPFIRDVQTNRRR